MMGTITRWTCQILAGNPGRCGLRLSTSRAHISRPQQRCLSSESPANIIVEREDDTGVAVLKLNNKPVNSLTMGLLSELHQTLDKLQTDKTCQGVILTSANPGVFSAGLDIMEMYRPDTARLAEFWRHLQEVYLQLYTSRLITIAAINGHAPAGGCFLCTLCDYRVMATPKFTIGLNETQLGLNAPFWFIDAFVNTVGQRQAEYCLQLGRMMSSEEAHNIGLVDELADIGQVFDKARAEMNKWLKMPAMARHKTKTSLRNNAVQKLLSRREEDVGDFVDVILTDTVQKTLAVYIESLKKKKKN